MAHNTSHTVLLDFLIGDVEDPNEPDSSCYTHDSIVEDASSDRVMATVTNHRTGDRFRVTIQRLP